MSLIYNESQQAFKWLNKFLDKVWSINPLGNYISFKNKSIAYIFIFSLSVILTDSFFEGLLPLNHGCLST